MVIIKERERTVTRVQEMTLLIGRGIWTVAELDHLINPVVVYF